MYRRSDCARDDNGNLHEPDQSDIWIGLANMMGTGRNLQQATITILCEPVDGLKVKSQVPKRAHGQGDPNGVWYYLLSSQTTIENIVD